MFAAYCFNAGATVVAFRPIGHQTNEVVLDNVSPAVRFSGAWINGSATSGYFGHAGEVGYRYVAIDGGLVGGLIKVVAKGFVKRDS